MRLPARPVGGRPLAIRIDRRPLGYREAWELQRRLVARRLEGEIPDVLLLTEHPPAYTLGRRAKAAHLLGDRSRLRALGAEVISTDRGGDVTFHGPGQLVIYPIMDLRGLGRDVGRYLRLLEEVVIRAVAAFGVRAGRREGLTGVWSGVRSGVPGAAPGKLAAIGVRVEKWITMHGAALNVRVDPEWFSEIVPCGIEGCRTVSLADLVESASAPPTVDAVADAVADAFRSVFGREFVGIPERSLRLEPIAASGPRRDLAAGTPS